MGSYTSERDKSSGRVCAASSSVSMTACSTEVSFDPNCTAREREDHALHQPIMDYIMD
jgi:hypothetical protein